MDILTGENLSSIQLDNIHITSFICQFVHPVVGDGVKGVDGRIVILASYKLHFIRVHENLMQHPCNISILPGVNSAIESVTLPTLVLAAVSVPTLSSP